MPAPLFERNCNSERTDRSCQMQEVSEGEVSTTEIQTRDEGMDLGDVVEDPQQGFNVIRDSRNELMEFYEGAIPLSHIMHRIDRN